MENTLIKLYSIDSDLSSISDEIIDSRSDNTTLDFKICDQIVLVNRKTYKIILKSRNNQFPELSFIFQNENLIKCDCDFESKILTRTSKSPFSVELFDSDKLLAKGLFYRYRNTNRKNIPSDWDKNFDPSAHQIIDQHNVPKINNKKYQNNSIPNNNNLTNMLKSELIDEVEMLSEESSDDQNDGKNTMETKFKKDVDFSNLKNKVNFNKNNLIDDKDFVESKNDSHKQTECKFYSFVIRLDKDEDSITEVDKIFMSNHAIRVLQELHNVKNFAYFKLNIYGDTKQYEDKIRNFLIKGIDVKINGKNVTFFFIGSSNSGMKEHSFWAIDKKDFNFNKFIESMGNFSMISSIEKLNKRYSLFFTSSLRSIKLKRGEYKIIKDEIMNKYCFTDGIGLMRLKTCQEISQKIGLNYTSNIFQIRCGGYKGVLVGFPDKIFESVEHDISSKCKIIFRKSQEKFDAYDFDLNIVSWSPYESSQGSLNSEFLMILDGLSENGLCDYILKLFKFYLDEFEDSLIDPKKAVSKLINSKEINEFSHKYKMILMACEKNLKEELDFKMYKIIRDVLIEQSLFNLITKRRFSISIEKSRYLIGVLDETNQLNEDEIFVSFRSNNGSIEYLNNLNVIVARNPCYSLSEVRKVRARYLSDLEHLENCVVFSKKGKRPLVNILSGGDLDGDIFFVSWDENLTCIQNSEITIDYPETIPEKNDLIGDNKNLSLSLIDNFTKRILSQDKIGLWHYYLTSLYHIDKENMKKNDYINGVIEINKSIDGIISSKNVPKLFEKPEWYLTTKDLAPLDQLETGDEKFKKLEDILREKKLDSNKKSLLSRLTEMAFKKFLEIMSKKDDELNGSFLNQGDIDLLKEYKIISLNISDDSIRKDNLTKIKKKYESFVKEIKSFETKTKDIKNNNSKLYQGMYEKKEKEKFYSKNEIEKVKIIEEFRNFVINLNYSNDEILDQNLKMSVFCLDGFHFRSRVLSLYLDLKDTLKINDLNGSKGSKGYSNIPWIFYDVLCYLKNFCNDKRSNKTLPTLIPFTISAQCTNFLSAKKLLIHNKI